MRRLILAGLAGSACLSVAVAQTPAAPTFKPVPDNAILSRNVTGLAVTNEQNQKVGTIEDVVIESGRLGGYVLSVGGFLGVGRHYVVIAPDGLVVSYDATRKIWGAKVDATVERLKSAPEFVYEGRWSK